MKKLISTWLPLVVALLVTPAFASTIDASNWSATVTSAPDGYPLNSVTVNNPDPNSLVMGFNYGIGGGWGVSDFQMNFSTTAATDQVANFTLDYSGFSAWYEANNYLDLYVNGPSGNTTTFLSGGNITSQPESVQVYGGYTWGFLTGGSNFDSTSIIANTITLTQAVPEPETYAMLLAGLGLLGFIARRRKQKEAAAA